MTHKNIAFLSDIHGNSPALQAVLADMDKNECSQVFMLGDIVNGLDPHGCIQLLRNWRRDHHADLICLKGNGEEYMLTPDLDSMPDYGAPWKLEMIPLAQWWQDHLTTEDIEWIRAFHDFVRWDDICLVHDRPADRLMPESWHNPDIDPKYQEWFFHSPGIFPAMPEDDWKTLWNFMDNQNLSVILCAHTHIPFYREHNGKRVCNTGSVGMPVDGDPRPSWVLATSTPDGRLNFEIRRVTYDTDLSIDLINRTPDYYDFKDPEFVEAYKKWMITGLHWSAHLKKDA